MRSLTLMKPNNFSTNWRMLVFRGNGHSFRFRHRNDAQPGSSRIGREFLVLSQLTLWKVTTVSAGSWETKIRKALCGVPKRCDNVKFAR